MRIFLLVDDDPVICRSMKIILEGEGFTVRVVHDPDEAIALVRQHPHLYSLIFVDHHLGNGVKGPTVIAALRKINARIPIIAFSCDEHDEPHNESLESGALMFVQKDISTKRLLGIIHRACREGDRWQKPLMPSGSNDDNAKLIQSVKIVGRSAHLADAVRLSLKFASTENPVFIRGENGTGKEQFARIIHENSSRRGKPFIALNCGGLNTGVIESELFGHMRGSFTGAMANKIGKFEAANGGTLFLDEIGDMPLPVQVNFLRVLQEKEITPLGSNVTKKIDVRIIAATNAPLEEKIESGQFRSDLHYRLNVLPIQLNPLRERPDDIPPLIHFFLEEENRTKGKIKTILESCVEELQRLPWHGNVRELKNAIARMHAITDGPQINEEALNLIAPIANVSGKAVRMLDHQMLMIRHNQDEIELITSTLRISAHLNDAAKRLGMTRSHLRSRMKALKIENPFADREESV